VTYPIQISHQRNLRMQDDTRRTRPCCLLERLRLLADVIVDEILLVEVRSGEFLDLGLELTHERLNKIKM